MTDNKSLTYLMQLEENTKSEFTEVKNKIDNIDLSIGDLSSITSTIDTMQSNVISLNNNMNSISVDISDIRNIVSDILEGSTYSPWISELREKGASSSVYSDSSKMTSLIGYYKGVSDYTITKYLMQWAIDNNKFSIFAETASNNAEFEWSTITNPVKLFSNEEAFTLFAKNAACIKAIFPETWSNNIIEYSDKWLFDYIKDYINTVEPGLRASSAALNVIDDCTQTSNYGYNFTVSANKTGSKTLGFTTSGCFINNITFSSKPSSVTITNLATKSTIVGGVDFELNSGKVDIARFSKTGNSVVTVKAGNASVNVSFSIMDLYVV